MLTRTVDNLQVTINNLHVRIESNNSSFSSDLFSMGLTLQKLTLVTTNENWEPIFIDRTQNENKNTTLHKILDIEDLGFYYKPHEQLFISELESDSDKRTKLAEIFP